MARPLKPPRLWLRRRKGIPSKWVILDYTNEIHTFVPESEFHLAQKALAKYLAGEPIRPIERPKRQRLLKNGLVYFVGFGAYVKIGFTAGNDVSFRMNAIQTGCPEELVLYGTINGTRQDEQILHMRFATLRLKGEWFRLAGELKEWIATEFPRNPSRKRGFLGGA